MTGHKILQELNKTMIRYRAGMINSERCRQELSVLLAMLRVYEDIVLEEKLNKIKAVLEMRA